jgi:hypothetical protein
MAIQEGRDPNGPEGYKPIAPEVALQLRQEERNGLLHPDQSEWFMMLLTKC